MSIRKDYSLVAACLSVVLVAGIGSATSAAESDADLFVTAVKPIIDNKCASCHVAESHNFKRVPERKGACYTCHNGTKILPGVKIPAVYAYPPLTTKDEVLASVAKGTFKGWLMPGGFMAWDGNPNDYEGNPYPKSFALVHTELSANEHATLTDWADSIGSARELDYDPNLQAAKIASDFEPDGTGTANEWGLAKELVVKLTPTVYTAAREVKMKALYSTKYLYIRTEYKDPTLSMTRGGWLRTGGTWTPATKDPALADDYPSEDRIAFLWNINIPDFKASYGCALKCHGNQPGYASYTDRKDTKADIWHAKANRALGVVSAMANARLTVDPATHEISAGQATMKGYSDDKYLEWYKGPNFDTEDAGRRGDAGSSTYGRNRNGAKSAPKYMESNPTDFLDAMILTKREISDGETIVTDPDSDTYVGDRAVNAAWAKYAKFNAVVPERILRKPAGSRGDVQHHATWKGGIWVSEFKRLLDTGNPADDVIFKDLNAQYEFSITVFDNCGRGELPPGHTTYGNGQYLILSFSK